MALSYFDKVSGGVHQLWVSDGTVPGTHVVASFGSASSGSNAIFNLTTIGSRVFFGVDDGVHGRELWTSNGTAAGTLMVKDIAPGPNSGQPISLLNVDGTLYFDASDGTHGFELWKSDGSPAGTLMVKDIDTGSVELSSCRAD